jgi:hypothetical protein
VRRVEINSARATKPAMLSSSMKTDPLRSEDNTPQSRMRQAAKTAAGTALRNLMSP